MENNSNRSGKKLGVAELACYGIGNCIGFTGHSIVLALIAANLMVLFAYA